jgi:signal-transduction protein with cAMP-binding, CBS, and nucleotidyltransferase domain
MRFGCAPQLWRQGKDPQFITALVAKLRMEYYAEGDIVIHEGETGNVMYFVVKGHLEERQYLMDSSTVGEEVRHRIDAALGHSRSASVVYFMCTPSGGGMQEQRV